jgi:capsular exopolysaccharide synthesis family protein
VNDAHEPGPSAIGLRHYVEVVRRRKWIILAVLVAAIGAAATFSALQQPRYRAETKIVVGQGNSLFQPTVSSAVQPFTATMGDLVRSRVVAVDAINRLGLRLSPQTLLSKLSVSINPQTAVVKISVDDRDPERARQLAGAVADAFTSLVKDRFGKPEQPLPGVTVQPPLTATIWDPSHVQPGRVAPRPKQNIAIAAALGLVLALLAGFLVEHFDRRLRSRESVEEHFGVPVIGQIPFDTQGRRTRRTTVARSSGAGAEAFRAVRANLQYLGVERPLRTVLVTSAAPQQGKTTVTAGLATAIARSGATTIAVEGDLRQPRLHEPFGVARSERGLTSVLVGAAALDDVVVQVPLPVTAQDGRREQATATVALLPSGPLPPNPSELLSSTQMRELLERLGESYDYVLIDSPPLLAVADALELARIVDGVVLTARRNRSTTDEAREVRALVERLAIHLVGVVFTDIRSPVGYGYGYGDGPDRSAELPVEEVVAQSASEPREAAISRRRQTRASRP